MSRTLLNFLAFLVYSNIYVALPVVCITMQTGIQINSSPEPIFLVFIYSATLFSYCFHRIVPFSKKDARFPSTRHVWIANNKAIFRLIIVLAFAICAVSFTFLKEDVFLFILPAGLLTLFYTVPFIKIRDKWTRLRDIPFIKLFVVGITVTYVTVLLPFLHTKPGGTLLNMELLLIAAERFFFLLAITIPFDIRDIKFDKDTGLKTFPLLFGVQKSIYLSYLSIFLFMSLSGINYFLLHKHLLLLLAMISSGIFTAICISRASPDKSEYFFSLLIEGAMILQFLLVLLAFHYV